MKLVFYSILVPNTVYWITYFVICEVLKMDSLVGAIIGSAATIFAGILGLIGVCISNGRKSKKLNDNLVKLQDCQIGVKDGELSIANRLGVTNGEGTNLTAQHKILREDHKDIKIILNEEIKKSINSVADNAKNTYTFIVNESEMRKQKEQLLQSNEYRWAQAITSLRLWLLHRMKNDYWNCCHELSDLFELEPVFQPHIAYATQKLIEMAVN